jgi:serine/threonine protein kinase
MMVGKTISHYKILQRLGGGGMGIVYKAEDTRLERPVALKFLPPALTCDPEAKARFIQEARAASALDHPNICTIHEIDETKEGQIFIVMACYEGETLKLPIDIIANCQLPIANCQLAIDDSIDIAIQIAQGLAQAHQKDIIHRDIKPANIMITGRGEVKIIDFGLARLAGVSRITKAEKMHRQAIVYNPNNAEAYWNYAVYLDAMGQFDEALIKMRDWGKKIRHWSGWRRPVKCVFL